ncbi:MAG: cytochrome oxidase putative small subunit CydP [Piscinibacter sp.]|uniref:cytochrome oxidase putative small subunit CydP n=1 Tax=Piscinibacter sp. TaxID=1903157 RepID=UPI003D11466B
MTDRRLVRHLAIAVLLKLLALVVLWVAFVRDARVDVDANEAVSRLGTPFTSAPPHQDASR